MKWDAVIPFVTLSLFAMTSLPFLSRHLAEATISSYVKQICERLPIHTTIERTPGDNGFRIIIEGLPSEDKYKPGETYTVVVNGSQVLQRLMGLMVQATASDSKGIAFMPGRFNTSIDGRVQDLREDDTCEKSIVAHRYLVNKDQVRFLWTAPSTGVGCIHFNATVIEHSDVWYKDDGKLHKVICEEQPTQQDSASALDSNRNNPGIDECCACGHAMYTVKFQGEWSRQTHPKGFPDEKNAFQLHWSNVVGATHSSDYHVWKYGEFATRAVKEVCEYGSSRSLETEMKKNGGKIRTVIKTKQLWGPERILEPLRAVYTVNKKKHFLSLITMIGPSPDWCLGLSSESMCLPNCTWRDSLDIDLYPWDAGVDSRVTYMGRKEPTNPPEKIHRITSTFPSHRDSPFYGEEIKPFARLTIRKDKEACTNEDGVSVSAEESPTTDELVSDMKKKMMLKKKLDMEKCATSQWSEWSDCSNPCGSGVRERRRMLKNPGITAAMCSLDLHESETCLGDCTETDRNKLHENFVMRHDIERDPNDLCAITAWSEWSPCSATCGLGMKERWRMYLHKSQSQVGCGKHLVEKDLCEGEIFDCRKAMMMKNFTSICQQRVDQGPCRGNFTRWFYNHTMEKCQMFSYGGCRGNENRFETESECVDLCADHMANIFRKGPMMNKNFHFGNSQLMDNQFFMDKEEMMEKQRQMEKQRMMEKQKTMEDDMRRKEQMMQKQKMMEQQRQMEEKRRQMEKQRMMEKQRTMEDDMRRKEEMMKKQRMEEKQRRMEKERMMEKQRRMEEQQRLNDAAELKTFMMKKQMMRQHGDLIADGIGDNDDGRQTPEEEEKRRMMRKQKKMMRKKQKMMERKRRRRRRRQKKLRMEKERNGQNNQADGPEIDCMVTPWSAWSDCSVTCGKGIIMKTRMIKRQPQNGGRRCPRRLVKKRKCRQKKCPVNCRMDRWSSWTPCSATCGENSLQIRKRAILKRPKHGGLACPSKREKRFCNVPLCPDSQIEDDMRRYIMYHSRY